MNKLDASSAEPGFLAGLPLAACCQCLYESHGLPNGQAIASDASDGLPFGSMCYNLVMQDPASQSTADQRICTILAEIDDPEMPMRIVC